MYVLGDLPAPIHLLLPEFPLAPNLITNPCVTPTLGVSNGVQNQETNALSRHSGPIVLPKPWPTPKTGLSTTEQA